MTLRKHQIDLVNIIDNIATDHTPYCKYILAEVTPGGGKSALPIIMTRLIDEGLADKLCWVVPRKSLQHQGESNFQDPFFRDLLRHRRTIRSSTNDRSPCRGLDGFVTTYQAIGVDTDGTVAEAFAQDRYILVLDEFHHCEFDGAWAKAIGELVWRAHFVLLMTGTLERGDRQRIAFVDYANSRPVVEDSDTHRVIQYNRADALADGAIIPIHFHLADGAVYWMNEMGANVSYESMAQVAKTDASKAIYTALDTEYAQDLLGKGLVHWSEYRRHVPTSRLLVVTANIGHAQKAVEWLRRRGCNAEIATSHDSPEAHRAIKRFRAGDIDILVTIAMAYEGLDVPTVSHIICLTHIRSTPWIEQMIARAVRINRAVPYDQQYAYVFAPDDPLIRTIVDRIKKEQAPTIKDRIPREQAVLPGFEGGGGYEAGRPQGITPMGSEMAGMRDMIVGDHGPVFHQPIETPSEKENRLRDQIEQHVRRFAFVNRYRESRINTEIKSAMGKARADMDIPDLEHCLNYVRGNYPINITGHAGMSLPPGVARPRGTGRRVSTKAERVM
jgi:superfamily II DNA or RNA helicase